MALSPWPPTTSAATLKTATATLRAAIGEQPNASDPFAYDSLDSSVQRLGATVAAHVERFAPDAPQAVRDEALARAAAWLWDTRGAQRIDSLAGINVNGGAK